jgi:Leucine-rich repeat (LRR) protein
LKSSPFVIYHLPSLRSLDISRNKLVALPAGIHQLVNLEYLDVWDTGIAHLPEDLEQLKNLKFVDVRGMTYSPAFIEKMGN